MLLNGSLTNVHVVLFTITAFALFICMRSFKDSIQYVSIICRLALPQTEAFDRGENQLVCG
jgi:hypothetical protein